MARYLATKTLNLINEKIAHDRGASFRSHLGKVIPHIGDAYNAEEFPFRSHLGVSGIGNQCERVPWYGFHWAKVVEFEPRLYRLFNRGHLEEARFIALLLMIGAEVYQQDAQGNQYRVISTNGHFGGSGDGVVIGIPDLDPGTPALTEFKTASQKSFAKFESQGVAEANFTYFVQMQCYMKEMGIAVALFMVVNKNDDNLYAELVPYDPIIAERYWERGERLSRQRNVPEKLSEKPSWYECKWCDYKDICHYDEPPLATCRSCIHSDADDDGKWYCRAPGQSNPSGRELDKYEQLNGCNKHIRLF